MAGLLKGIVRTGAVAGAAVTGAKVAKRVKENNPEGVKDVNGDGKIDYKDTVSETKRAAIEIFDETRERFEVNHPDWKEKAESVAARTEEVLQEAGEKAQNAVKIVVDKLDDLF